MPYCPISSTVCSSFLDCRNEVDARFVTRCPQTQIPGQMPGCPPSAEVYVRGFSAGSYSGICLLHLLWNMPHVQVGGILGGISCPPALIHGISPEHGQSLMLIHLTTDRLCQWHPDDGTLRSLNCKYCIVNRTTQELRELFGSCEHSYGHWIDISLPHGRYPLYQLLRRFSDVALPKLETLLH